MDATSNVKFMPKSVNHCLHSSVVVISVL